MKKTYETVNGQILAEYTAGVATEYVHDALGSVIATTDANRNVQNAYRWAGYGTQIERTGTATDPKFLWNGINGYRATGRIHADRYVRRRHYGTQESAWASVDPLWRVAQPYAYAGGSPAIRIDASGLLACHYITWNPFYCGAASFQIRWVATDEDIEIIKKDVPPKAGDPKTGWLVQHVIFSRDSSTCCPTGLKPPPQCQPSDNYYEAWLMTLSSDQTAINITGGEPSYCNYAYQSEDHFDMPEYPCCYKSGADFSIKGHARVYANSELKNEDNPSNWTYNGDYCSHCLATTKKAPAEWSDSAKGMQSHSLIPEFSCCPDRSKTGGTYKMCESVKK